MLLYSVKFEKYKKENERYTLDSNFGYSFNSDI